MTRVLGLMTVTLVTDESECDWAHVRCDAENKTQRLIFQINNFSGKLPMDLAVLQDTLEYVGSHFQLASHGEVTFTCLTTLRSLKYLDLDDNFIESRGGLPQNFKQWENLEEFKASYNLMSGPLDNGVLETLQKLSTVIRTLAMGSKEVLLRIVTNEHDCSCISL